MEPFAPARGHTFIDMEADMATSMKAVLAIAGGLTLLAGCADYSYDNGLGDGYGHGAPGYAYYDDPDWYAGLPVGFGLGFAFVDRDHERHERHEHHEHEHHGDHDHDRDHH